VATGGPTAGDGPDAAQCTTGADGTCTFTIELVNQNDPLLDPTNNPMTVTLLNTGGTNTQTTEAVTKTWFISGTVGVVDATPELDTNEVGATHTITCKTTDAGGTAVATQTCAARVTGGTTGNAGRDLDGNVGTTAGYIGSCETGASGTCTMSYVSGFAGNDQITVFNDPDRSQTVTGGELSDVISKDWVAVGQGPSRVGADVEAPGSTGTNGSANSQFCNSPTSASSDANAISNTSGSVQETAELFCAQAFSSNGSTVAATQITFTITSGPGQFTNRAGTANLGSTVVTEGDACNAGQVPASSGNFNCTFIKSPTSGNTTVTACITGTTNCITLTKLWFSSNARTVTCTPESAVNEPGTTHDITCTVKDNAGNVVPQWRVEASETGPGHFVGPTAAGTSNGFGTCSQGYGACGLTDAEGQIVFTVQSNEGEEGTETIIGSLAPFHQNNNTVDECERAAGDPTAAPAGVCEDTVTKTWEAGVEPPVLTRGACSGFAEGSRTARSSGGFVIVGTPGDDVLDGSGGGDLICGLGGDDVIDGRGGGDQISGGGGNDNVGGGGDKDTIGGGGGDDVISGNGGNDNIKGNGGNDALKGNAGIDTLTAGDGNDSLQGGDNPDVLKGGPGDDTLRGGKGRDLLDGGAGTDQCFGNAGADDVNNCE
jgi:Ca2+-binding RTX toxin-like protein